MSLRVFLMELWTTGQASVGRYGKIPQAEIDDAERALIEFEEAYRRELPGTPPPVLLPAAAWGAVRFYRAAQMAVFRDLGEEVMVRELSAPCPHPSSPAVHYALDLTHRFLPGLLALAERAARSDPLVERLRSWGREWPLSSVGIAGLGPLSAAGFAADPCLLRLYADRILAAGDASRLEDPRACDAVRAAIGLHPELAGRLAAHLERSLPNPATDSARASTL